ncbi:exodeoxyribonuclease VII small subunit [Hahella sp. SMD15-11]|uniref:Exodeoxyribonuclease 7 small subunit n=1 Tax=Thermohahella caldifontis TaxID=3142973 RepID=A0AB39UWX3_9GAMM
MAETPDFETALAQLEGIVRALEQGDLKLEEALERFETGVHLSRLCQDALRAAELRVEKLLADDPDTSGTTDGPEDLPPSPPIPSLRRMPKMTSHSETLAHWRQQIDRRLEQHLETLPAGTLRDAMHYALTGPGKRVRPLLAMATADVLNGRAEDALDAACALEMIHTYSLVHDDLPAMDDDALRRGRPTCHIRFDEATAILAGDALLTLAFEVLGRQPGPAARHLGMVTVLARASGAAGMVAGQAWDMEATGRNVDLDTLKRIHRHKTGALIQASLVMGALAANADQPLQDQMAQLGDCLGLAFQIQDDILDEVSDTETLGKAAGHDREQNKSTYVRLLGLDGARREADRLMKDARRILDGINAADTPLARLIDDLAQRNH